MCTIRICTIIKFCRLIVAKALHVQQSYNLEAPKTEATQMLTVPQQVATADSGRCCSTGHCSCFGCKVLADDLMHMLGWMDLHMSSFSYI